MIRKASHFSNRKSKRAYESGMESIGEHRIQEVSWDYYFVIDFEATCDKKGQVRPQEIIEIPIMVVDARTFKRIDRFHRYVKPTKRPCLTTFCKELTGISQETVNKSLSFEELYPELLEFVEKYHNHNTKALTVTYGDWDFVHMWPSQLECLKIKNGPEVFKSWINLRKTAHQFLGYSSAGLEDLLNKLHLRFEGSPHSGIDDTVNTVRALEVICKMGAIIAPNGGNAVKATKDGVTLNNEVVAPSIIADEYLKSVCLECVGVASQMDEESKSLIMQMASSEETMLDNIPRIVSKGIHLQ